MNTHCQLVISQTLFLFSNLFKIKIFHFWKMDCHDVQWLMTVTLATSVCSGAETTWLPLDGFVW